MEPREAVLHLDGWAGRTTQACVVVAETPHRYRVRAPERGELRLPKGRHGLVKIWGAETKLVPKSAVSFPL